MQETDTPSDCCRQQRWADSQWLPKWLWVRCDLRLIELLEVSESGEGLVKSDDIPTWSAYPDNIPPVGSVGQCHARLPFTVAGWRCTMVRVCELIAWNKTSHRKCVPSLTLLHNYMRAASLIHGQRVRNEWEWRLCDIELGVLSPAPPTLRW